MMDNQSLRLRDEVSAGTGLLSQQDLSELERFIHDGAWVAVLEHLDTDEGLAELRGQHILVSPTKVVPGDDAATPITPDANGSATSSSRNSDTITIAGGRVRLPFHMSKLYDDAPTRLIRKMCQLYPEGLLKPYYCCDAGGSMATLLYPIHMALIAGSKARIKVLRILFDATPESLEIPSMAAEMRASYPIHCWAIESRCSIEVIRFFLRRVPECSQAKSEYTEELPIHEAAKLSVSSESESLYVSQLIALLLEANPEGARQKNRFGSLPLHRVQSAAATNMLLGVYPEGAKERDDAGRLPLHIACIHSNIWMCVEPLLIAYPEAAVLEWTRLEMLDVPMELLLTGLYTDLEEDLALCPERRRLFEEAFLSLLNAFTKAIERSNIFEHAVRRFGKDFMSRTVLGELARECSSLFFSAHDKNPFRIIVKKTFESLNRIPQDALQIFVMQFQDQCKTVLGGDVLTPKDLVYGRLKEHPENCMLALLLCLTFQAMKRECGQSFDAENHHTYSVFQKLCYCGNALKVENFRSLLRAASKLETASNALTAKDSRGNLPFHPVWNRVWPEKSEKNDSGAVPLIFLADMPMDLLAKQIMARNANGDTPLHVALTNGHNFCGGD
jgi:ankyrin repeat protein